MALGHVGLTKQRLAAEPRSVKEKSKPPRRSGKNHAAGRERSAIHAPYVGYLIRGRIAILAIMDSGLTGWCLRSSGAAPLPRNRLEARYPSQAGCLFSRTAGMAALRRCGNSF